MEATYKIEEKLILIHCGKWKDAERTIIEKGSESLREIPTLATIKLRGRTFYLPNYFENPELKNITCEKTGFSAYNEFIEFQQLRKTVFSFEKFILERWDKYLKITDKHKINKILPTHKWVGKQRTYTPKETTPVWLF